MKGRKVCFRGGHRITIFEITPRHIEFFYICECGNSLLQWFRKRPIIDSTKSEFRDRGSNVLDDICIARIETIPRLRPRPCKFTEEGPQVSVFAQAFELA